ncbi:MAG: hypothetical protein ACR2MO_13970 [Acidimicrobiales bacterium]
MAPHTRWRGQHRQKPRRQAKSDGFIAALPEDDDWMVALHDGPDGPDDADEQRARDEAAQGFSDLREELEAQREVIVALAAKVEALEASSADAGLASAVRASVVKLRQVVAGRRPAP